MCDGAWSGQQQQDRGGEAMAIRHVREGGDVAREGEEENGKRTGSANRESELCGKGPISNTPLEIT